MFLPEKLRVSIFLDLLFNWSYCVFLSPDSVFAWLPIFLYYSNKRHSVFVSNFFFHHHMQSNVYVHLTNHFFLLCAPQLCSVPPVHAGVNNLLLLLYRRYFCKSCIFLKVQRKKNWQNVSIFFSIYALPVVVEHVTLHTSSDMNFKNTQPSHIEREREWALKIVRYVVCSCRLMFPI